MFTFPCMSTYVVAEIDAEATLREIKNPAALAEARKITTTKCLAYLHTVRSAQILIIHMFKVLTRLLFAVDRSVAFPRPLPHSSPTSFILSGRGRAQTIWTPASPPTWLSRSSQTTTWISRTRSIGRPCVPSPLSRSPTATTGLVVGWSSTSMSRTSTIRSTM